MTFRRALEVAGEPRSRFFFGSPCRFVARIDFTCHVFVPSMLRKGDLSQQSAWDRGRAWASVRLLSTSPRWQHLVNSFWSTETFA